MDNKFDENNEINSSMPEQAKKPEGVEHIKYSFSDNVFNMHGREENYVNTGKTISIARSKRFITLGWVFAALGAFINPYFAIAGVTFGLLANREVRGIGNYVIAANLVLGVLSLILGFFGLMILRMLLGG